MPRLIYQVPHQQKHNKLAESRTISQLKPIYWAKKPAKSKIGIDPVLYIMNCKENTRPRTLSGERSCMIVCVGILTQAIATPRANVKRKVIDNNKKELDACS